MSNNVNYAIMGPGGATNNSMRKAARKLVKGTVLKSYFRNTWKSRNQAQNYAIWSTTGDMVGFALIKKSGDELDISLIGAKQGKGIGSRLMTKIIDDAKERGIKTIKLDSVPSALGFYVKYGFMLTSFDDEHIHMKLDLTRKPLQVIIKPPSPKKKSPVRRRRVAATNTASRAAGATAARRSAAATRSVSSRAASLASARTKK